MNKFNKAKIIYVFYALLSGTLLGSIGVLATAKSHLELSTSAIFFWRFFLASLILLPFVLNHSNVTLERRNIVYLMITGVILYGPAILFYFSSISNITITMSIVLYGILFVFISFFARLVSKGKISIRAFIEIFILALGLYFIFVNSQGTKNMIIIIVGTILYATALLTNKIYSKTLSTRYSAFVICLGIALFFLGVSLLNKTFSFPFQNYDFLSLFLIGAICTALPILLIIKSLDKLSTLQLSVLLVIEPLFSSFLKAGGVSNESNLKQSIATAVILLTMLVHKHSSKKL